MSTQLYALIKRTSEYSYQREDKQPFLVELTDYADSYPVRGNNNCYRLSDVNLYVLQGEQFTSLSGGKPIPVKT